MDVCVWVLTAVRVGPRRADPRGRGAHEKEAVCKEGVLCKRTAGWEEHSVSADAQDPARELSPRMQPSVARTQAFPRLFLEDNVSWLETSPQGSGIIADCEAWHLVQQVGQGGVPASPPTPTLLGPAECWAPHPECPWSFSLPGPQPCSSSPRWPRPGVSSGKPPLGPLPHPLLLLPPAEPGLALCFLCCLFNEQI